MPTDPFVHLHVASGYSLQHGASLPPVLVDRAAAHGMDVLALTDRDGTYGAVKFAKACHVAGISPVLGVDLAYRPADPTQVRRGMSYGAQGRSSGSYDVPGGAGARGSRTPVRGGAFRDARLPRVTLLAQSSGPGGGRAGWAAVCRITSATHLAGERGAPVLDPEDPEVAALLGAGDVVVLLGPSSSVGRAVTAGRPDLARAEVARWRALVPRGCLVVEVVSHLLGAGGPGTADGAHGTRGWGPGSTPHAARMLNLAAEQGLLSILSNQVRHADRGDAAVADVLDAARRLVALDRRHVDRGNAEGHLKSGPQMSRVAAEVAHAAGVGESGAWQLLARTRTLAERCALDVRADLGLGEVHFPEFELANVDGLAIDPRETGADGLLRARCEAAIGTRYGSQGLAVVWKRLDDELAIIRDLGYASYFLTVADVTDLIRDHGVRVAARGSGAGSIVTYLLGISGVDPVRHQLLMERFLSPLRQALPDIDVDVESAQRTRMYEAILDRFGGERCVCVSMMDTYRVRHAVRDVGAALGMPPLEVDAIAKAFPHIRARDARAALAELPELRASGLGETRLELLFALVERLDGLPRHVAVHPCGVLLSDATLLDRTPVEASYAGFPMSQFDKDDVEDLGLLKLDVLGIRMQSAMAHAVTAIERTEEVVVDVDDEAQVPFDDPATYAMISSSRTLGVFQIESPGQRELVGKSGIETFEDVITDISLFRPGPVKSDMITPYLDVKHGWKQPRYAHPLLRPILEGTRGVVVFHEQVIEIIAAFTGISFAEADEKRRALGDAEGMAEVRTWFFPRAQGRDVPLAVVEELWEVLAAFASFGFCKAHAAAFALPTYQSAWLKAHYPAHFLAGVLTHDPGMYPKRLILEDARRQGVTVLPLDVNASETDYAVERLVPREEWAPDPTRDPGHPDGRPWGIRLALSEVKGISEAEVGRIVAARPYASLTDFWHRARVSRPVVERLVLAGGFDSVYGLDLAADDGVGRRGTTTRRDLLLGVSELDRQARSAERASRGRGLAGRKAWQSHRQTPNARTRAASAVEAAAARNSTEPGTREAARGVELPGASDARAAVRPRDLGEERGSLGRAEVPQREGVWGRSSAQARSAPPPEPVSSVQMALDLGDASVEGVVSGLPEMTAEERMRAELEILGLDASRHVVSTYERFLDELGTTRATDLLGQRSKAELLVAGVKVATQTPPIRSGRRVVFLTLDDGTGPLDATFFEDAQGPYAATVFSSWLLVVRGELRRTGHRGVSLRATGCWELPALHDTWRLHGIEAVREQMAVVPGGFGALAPGDERAGEGAAASRSSRPVMAAPPVSGPVSDRDMRGAGVAAAQGGEGDVERRTPGAAGGMGRRRVLVHSSGFRLSPYADVKPAGEDAKQIPQQVARKLWHRSPGSPG
ncbi:DNA polymerase III subunit alpha [Nocardioides bruguierae]|uniref:DNA polymerase III subunit alpha n=1 Tax=Nocardioides bruguierae TaxID=2945102 RepID=UPI0020220AFD|nr:DNA polymerase III subunit alpha [Nocardioides bruguierae]MCL8027004.1 DNA polymerase III subunit alpha [Nocardioides bruguierae]